ncbi:HD domain-containing protein [Sanguibacter sp. A247]|uniref:HD domain-containing protein n=1 Tax=unclassified Sanguibacter TaxID=2645534 RepID=UPI003FD73CA5
MIDGWPALLLVLVLLLACLVALILVLVARREASAVRAQAREDVASLREETQSRAQEADRRAARLDDERAALAAERVRLADQRTRAEQLSERLEARTELVATHEVELAERRATHDVRMLDELGQLAGMTAEDARTALTERLAEQAAREIEARNRRTERRLRAESEARARSILTTAIERLAVATSSQLSVAVVPLPSPDLKGPIIGRDGRNIRAFEALTGVNLIVDESDDHVQVSSFDAERREIAQQSLERMLADGRINLDRMERVVAAVTSEAEERSRESARHAIDEAGVRPLHPDLEDHVGRLRLRTSYGQVVQQHLVECALLAHAIATEVGADAESAARAAFLHDVGKAIPAGERGSHARAGADLARQCGESELIVNAIAAHHGEVPAESVEAVIVQIADAISASRPGARREDGDTHVERLEALERTVAAHPGVARALALASGHEVRVIVEPHLVGDDDLEALAGRIASAIVETQAVPGEVRVTVVRELRATATAG